MAATIRALAELVGGRVVGDDRGMIEAARPVTEAGPGDLTFLSDDRYLAMLAASPASAVLIGSGFVIPEPADRSPTMALIVVDDPRAAFTVLRAYLRGALAERWVGIHPTAVVSPSARLGAGVAIHAFAVVADDAELGEDCTIGPHCTVGERSTLGRDVVLHANVTIYGDVVIGDRCILHAGVVVGADGFGFQPVDGRHVKVPQSGGVIIEEDVEIGANSCVDQGTFGPTRIGAGTKIDNLVQVAHNVKLGKHNILCAGVGVGGSAVIGDFVMMGGQVGVRDHMTIGDGARVSAQSGVTRSLEAGVTVFGTPAVPLRQQLQMHSLSLKLPEMRRELIRLAEEVERMSSSSKSASGPGEEPGGAEGARNSSAA
ncbi:UDP-3-O-(3-hydroxymyristoyl)glucosamine N-acyltransferase [Tautonia plasticadhaerens]|uniref:UDP-3-O-acylglucosamine N-acyltransferase n=1 Tax=Tautonia plasticadhaerens TaxID=2527974 RepID=A0A518H344_9BACT|nr:UDP-3-O-(3-hydroxymyristoyl)glucosamine N-acyltransferase [Tautonia plasticadhaerens]QDV35253.1 UDP-3-O-acylglucosamine N-acyltransferase [Tautonia plasticadhaerens]